MAHSDRFKPGFANGQRKVCNPKVERRIDARRKDEAWAQKFCGWVAFDELVDDKPKTAGDSMLLAELRQRAETHRLNYARKLAQLEVAKELDRNYGAAW